MSELKLPRLLAAAKEFNVGQDTIVDFLAKKGFPKDDLKPTAKLTEAQYYALQAEFQSDKVARDKADHVELPKNASTDKAKKADDAPVADAGKKVNAADTEVKKTEAPKASTKKADGFAEEAPKATVTSEKAKAATLKVDAPEVESPKVVNKIDLSTIDSSTRPKKATKKTTEDTDKKAEAAKPAEATEAAKAADASGKAKAGAKKTATKKSEPAPPTDHSIAPENVHGEITNIQADKLTGPKILGKIDLPINSDTRPKPLSQEEKRTRKRIPVQGQGNRPQGQGQQGGGAVQGQGGGGYQGNRPQGGGGYQGNRPQGGGGYQGNRPNNRPGQAGGGARRNVPQTAEQKEIDKKSIQDKIKETQAKLSGQGGRGKSMKSKYRRQRREEAAENENNEQREDNKLQVTEFVTVSELSSLMDVSFADIISKCMNLGIMVSINQRLDAEVIELVASEFGFEVEFVGLEDVEEMDEQEEADDLANLVERPPIVTIMGHVDHGKTSLLDYIRKANVIAGEAGGITQHIGAYNVTLENGKTITFLDTPGHEAFTAMRARGAQVTDVAIIVVAADDSVMPQTVEAINHAQAAGVPIVIAINKIDKPGANPDNIRQALSQMNILVEEWGGKFQCQEISAKKGQGVEALLDKVLLEAEMLSLKANPSKNAKGTVIESELDKGRGYVSTILVEAGTLRVGDIVLAGCFSGKVKAMHNERGSAVKNAGPSMPVELLGLSGAPQAGDKFHVMDDEREAREIAAKRLQLQREQGIRTHKHITLDEIGRRLAIGDFKELNVIVKGDVDGSVEALADSLQKLSTEKVQVKIIHKSVGAISESDVLLASASNAIIIGFQVRPSATARKVAETEQIDIRLYSIIYDAINEIKAAMEGMLAAEFVEKIVCNIEIREVFTITKVGTIAGCMVLDGKVTRNTKIRVIRDGIVVHSGELGSLKRFKDDVKEVNKGFECGLNINGFNDIKQGDIIEGYEMVEVKAKL